MYYSSNYFVLVALMQDLDLLITLYRHANFCLVESTMGGSQPSDFPSPISCLLTHAMAQASQPHVGVSFLGPHKGLAVRVSQAGVR